jgi:nitrate/TMAO reductase-like tetraheme cytochrome c subunit
MDLTALLALQSAYGGAHKNTEKMVFRLNQSENRLSVIDENTSDIQASNEKYVTANENISRTMMEIEKTYEYFRVASEVKEIIREGLTASNQNDYLQAVVKLSLAKQFFESHREIKSSSSVLISIESLIQVMIVKIKLLLFFLLIFFIILLIFSSSFYIFLVFPQQANETCEEEFEKQLSSAGKSIEFADGQCQVVHPFSPAISKEIKALCDAFGEKNKTTITPLFFSSITIIFFL